MKILWIILVHLISFETLANTDGCLSGIQTAGKSLDMAVFHLKSAEVEEYDSLNSKTALLVLDQFLRQRASCDLSELGETKTQCHAFSANVVCEVRSAIGYFLIHRGAFGHFEHSVTWARWD